MQQADIEKDLIAQTSVMIYAKAQEVWTALLDPDAIRQYMFRSIETSWEEGASIRWRGEWKAKSFDDKGTVLRVEQEQLLQYTHFSSLSGAEDIPSNYHTVTITLAEEDDGVWIALSQDKNEDEIARKDSEKNWKIMLEGLKRHVEQR